MASRSFSEEELARLLTPDFWRALIPGFSISPHPFAQPPLPLNADCPEIGQHIQQVTQDGYFKINSILPEPRMQAMAKVITTLANEGLPTVFAYIYDDFWRVFRDLSPVLTPVFGENYHLSTNIWAWNIAADENNKGFSPHRDLSADGNQAVRPDGLPLLATTWIALTDVTTMHSCMYLLPSSKDSNVPDNLTANTVPKDAVQDIRALPGKAGSVISWNADVLHWGSSSTGWADSPRISMATYILRNDERLLKSVNNISLQPSQSLPFDFRLAVIGQMLSHYNEEVMSEEHLPQQLIDLCTSFTKEYSQPRKQQEKIPNQPKPIKKPGRNTPCPCGSGKKYKYCHGL